LTLQLLEKRFVNFAGCKHVFVCPLYYSANFIAGCFLSSHVRFYLFVKDISEKNCSFFVLNEFMQDGKLLAKRVNSMGPRLFLI